jgi:catechol 2,3-dioxygenase-like lactoylglutathione lyase family enzyme
MTHPPIVECDRVHPGLPVADVAAAVEFYTTRLGFTLGFTWGEPVGFAGVNLGKVQVFLEGAPPPAAPTSVFFVVEQVDELHAFHTQQGVEILVPPGDRDYGLRDYTVRDPFGHRLTFGQYTYHGGEPEPIERVDVPLRLEKRLAAVLADLAVHKRMSLSSCLEETLLHTFEPLGDGVASPHTRTDLRVIQQLKAKHGIDYDCHASYRFVERTADDSAR